MDAKQRHIIRDRLQTEVFDVAIIGGGINGAVAAAACSASRLNVALIEQKDFASGTSQESSNLVWGGIKYLESYEFGLVWDLCRSRNELMRRYPSEVEELRFFTNLDRGFRKPRFLIFLGSILYWLMGRFRTKAPRLLNLATINRDEPLVVTEKSQGGLEYSDCFLKDNDARFVFHFVRRAVRAGGAVLNYAKAVEATQQADNLWLVKVLDECSGEIFTLRAKVLINAGGPYVDAFNRFSEIKTKHKHIFSKGVHLIVPRINQSERVLTFFADDGRLFFVIPMGSCSCIGTTDTRVTELPAVVSDADRKFILDNINKRLRLKKPLETGDVIAERCGVRPLVIKGNAGDFDQVEWINLSRKHIIECDVAKSQVSIFGGKLTDCLNIGRELLDHVRRLGLMPRREKAWYGEGQAELKQQLQTRVEAAGLSNETWLGEGRMSERLWRLYGDDSLAVIGLIEAQPELRAPVVFGHPVLLAEVAFMAKHEMVVNLEDFLRRRTRLSLVVPREELLCSPGLKLAANLLFGPKADVRWEEYFKTIHPATL